MRRSSPPASSSSSTETPSSRRSSRESRRLLGLLAALIVLLIVFRTLVAGMMPIALALVALMTAFLLLFILAGFTDINTITPLLVSMIGLGVGIDYSLLIVTRFRQLLHEGLSPRDAAAEAGASAGRATIFAGLTVAISVSGLAFFGLDFVTKLGVGSALGVLTTVLLANSLLIAILARLGERRGIVRHIVFGILTLGLYWWYWAYKTHKTTKERTGQGLGGPLGLVLWILFYPVNAFVIPAEIGRMYRQAGKETRLTGWTGLWLFPFGLLIVPAFVWWWKVQGAMNRFLESDPDVAEPAPGIDRLKVPVLPPIDDSETARERTLIARWGRFVTRNHKPVFVVVLLAGRRGRGQLGARSARRLRPGDAADGADRPARVRSPRRGLRPRVQRADPDRRRRERRRSRRRSASTRACGTSRASRRRGSRSSTTRRRSRSSS